MNYYESAVGLGYPETTMGNFGTLVLQFGLGAVVAKTVSPKDAKEAMIEGGIAAVAVTQAAQALLPTSGLLFWVRNIAVAAGSGAIVGIIQQKQWERELEAMYAAQRLR